MDEQENEESREEEKGEKVEEEGVRGRTAKKARRDTTGGEIEQGGGD